MPFTLAVVDISGRCGDRLKFMAEIETLEQASGSDRRSLVEFALVDIIYAFYLKQTHYSV